MSEEMMIRHCSPTLAGMKTGNMVACEYESEAQMRESIRCRNKMLTKKGLRMIPLRYCGGRALVYVYRPQRLRIDLQNAAAWGMLRDCGYPAQKPQWCVAQLQKRLCEQDGFPHEIGLFLGYPPEDVRGFMEDSRNCKFVGYWKVYGDTASAMKTFEKYKKCTAVYSRRFAAGESLEQLTVDEFLYSTDQKSAGKSPRF